MTSVLSSSPACFQRSEHLAEVAVEVLDLDGVVQQVAADFGRIGQKRRHFGVGQLFASLQAAAFLVGAVRLRAAVPEAERLILAVAA